MKLATAHSLETRSHSSSRFSCSISAGRGTSETKAKTRMIIA